MTRDLRKHQRFAQDSSRLLSAGIVDVRPRGMDWVRWIELAGFLVALVATVAGLYSITVAQASLREDERRWQQTQVKYYTQEAVASAWETLRLEKSGNTGKVIAIETLYRERQNLQNLDLSCSRLNGDWDEEYGYCHLPPFLQGLRLAPEFLLFPPSTNMLQPNTPIGAAQNWSRRQRWKGADFYESNFEGADISRAVVRYGNFALSNLREVKFHKSDLSFASFIGADLSGAYLGGAEVMEADFLYANLSHTFLAGADVSGANFAGAYIGNTMFCGPSLSLFRDRTVGWGEIDFCAKGLSADQIESAWALTDEWHPQQFSEISGLSGVVPSLCEASPQHKAELQSALSANNSRELFSLKEKLNCAPSSQVKKE